MGPVYASGLDESSLQLASVSAAVARLGSDEPELLKRGDWVMPIASITKVMTALVVIESGADLDAWLPVVPRATPAAANAYSRIRLESEATRRDFLHLALMSSENRAADRKSTRLNSSHVAISYAVFCLKKKKITIML